MALKQYSVSIVNKGTFYYSVIKMGKRYYCDYCDKSFADSVQNRKKHMQGGQHQSLMKLHYLAFKDPKEILAEESAKRPCQRFSRGECTFGANCRFSHLTPQRRQELMLEIEGRKRLEFDKSKQTEESERGLDHEPTVEEWLERRPKLRKTGDEARPKSEGGQTGDRTEDSAVVFSLPPALQGIQDLPPSLIPPSAGCMSMAKHLDWG